MNQAYDTNYDAMPTREKMHKRSQRDDDYAGNDVSRDRKRQKKGIDRSGKVRHYADIEE